MGYLSPRPGSGIYALGSSPLGFPTPWTKGKAEILRKECKPEKRSWQSVRKALADGESRSHREKPQYHSKALQFMWRVAGK